MAARPTRPEVRSVETQAHGAATPQHFDVCLVEEEVILASLTWTSKADSATVKPKRSIAFGLEECKRLEGSSSGDVGIAQNLDEQGGF